MVLPSLSENFISTYVAKWILPPPDSIFQVLGTKKVDGDDTRTKFRVCFSDGINRFTQCMIVLVHPDKDILPPDLSIVQMKDESERDPAENKANTIIKANNKLIWVVGNFRILARGGTDVTERIGHPLPLDPNVIKSQHDKEQTGPPTTPSPSGKNNNNSSDLPPAVPSKRNHGAQVRSDDDEERSKIPRRALFTDGATGGHRATQPISQLNPFTNKFTIKARVIKKSGPRAWNNSRGSGHVFDVILQDASGEIKACSFNETAVKFGDIFKENKVYFISQAHVKNSNPTFNPTKHQYELSLTAATEVIECSDHMAAEVPSVKFNFVPIRDIERIDANEVVDVIGVCTGVEDIRDITVRKTGRQLKKRDLHILDQSESGINVTLWDKKADEFGPDTVGKVVRVRQAKISDFNGKSLSISFQSSIEIDPEGCPDTEQLKMWWDQRPTDGNTSRDFSKPNSGISASSIAEYSTLYEIQSAFRNVAASDPASFHKFEAYVLDLKVDNLMYHACAKCKKKVVDQANGTYRCEKCADSSAKTSWRYMLRAALADPTEYQWVTFFDDTAETVVGCSAQKLREIFEQDTDAYREKLHGIKYNRFEFVAKTKCETWNDENRIKMTIVAVANIHFAGRKERLEEEIKNMRSQLT